MSAGNRHYRTEPERPVAWMRRRLRRGWNFEPLEARHLLTATATVTFEATDGGGNVLQSITAGQQFQLRAVVQDTSGNGSQGGVISTYLNGDYDPSLVSIPSDATSGVVTWGYDFNVLWKENTQTPGQIINTGGIDDPAGPQPADSQPQLLFTLPATAIAPGVETFTPSLGTGVFAEYPSFDNTLTGDEITFVPAVLTVLPGHPAISVSGNGAAIADGAAATSAANDTDFGLRLEGETFLQTYTISNSGAVPLSLGSLSLSGSDSAAFSVVSQPPASVPAWSSATFSLQYAPSALGPQLCTVSFDQNDASQTTPFTFTIGGTGAATQLVLTGLGQPIVDGAQASSAANGTDFGYIEPGWSPAVGQYTVYNTGNTPLTFGDPTISTLDQNDFTVGLSPAALAPGQSEELQVIFSPTGGGLRQGTVSFADSDPTQLSPFTFVVSGIGSQPSITVSGNGVPIAANESTPSTSNGTDFGSAVIGGTPVTETFTIANGGPAPLTLGPAILSGFGFPDFQIIQQQAHWIAAGSSSNLVIQFSPSITIARTATVSFQQSDYTQPQTFQFNITGSGIDLSPTNFATVTFEATDASGNVLTSVPVGTQFQLRAIAQDTSGNGSAGGIFAAYLNGSYNPALATIPSDTQGPVATYAPAFVNEQTENTQTPGQLVDVGAFSGAISPPGSAPQWVFSLPVTAVAAGTETFTPSFTTDVGMEIDEWSDLHSLGASQVTFVPATIQITGGQPTIAVTGGSQSIAAGSSAPSSANDTDFGTAAFGGQPVTETYTISNSGTSALMIGNLALGGANAGDFTITSPPAASVVPGGLTTFTVQFAPTALGTRTATVSFDENDPTQTDPFTFPIQGEALPGLSIADTQVTVPDDSNLSTTATFTVSLSTAAAQTVTVNFATADGTALAGTDYQATSGTLTFAPGVTSQTISVTVPGTLYAEPTRQFTVSLSQPTAGLVTTGSATGSVLNNNVPSWTNPVTPNDVNGDNTVSPIDALVVINDLNAHGLQVDPPPTDGQHNFLDTNDDGSITPLDALSVINQVNTATAQVQAAVKQAAALQAALQSPASAAVGLSGAAVVSPAVTSVAAPAVAAGSASAVPAAQLVDLAMAVYNAEDLAAAGAGLSAAFSSGGTGRHAKG